MPKKRLYLILIAISCLLILIGFFAYRYFNQPKLLVVNQAVTTDQAAKLESKLDLQNDLNNFNQAQTTDDLSFCNLVKNEQSKTFCIQELAVKTKNTSSCLLISNQATQADCSANVLLSSAVTSGSLVDCQKIESTMIQQTCVEWIAGDNLKINCNLLSNQDLKNSCLAVIYYQQAKNENKVKICDQIPKAVVRANCLSELGKIDLHSDADKDGLDFLQEIINNTDPNKADTDGDGFKDGDELKRGFNPDGTGSLIPITNPNLIACSDIKDNDVKTICLFELKDKSLDFFKCSELKNSKLKDFCITNLNLLTK